LDAAILDVGAGDFFLDILGDLLAPRFIGLNLRFLIGLFSLRCQPQT